MYSWLSLAPAVGGGPDDALEAREVIGMHLRADVAVLSACDTARGEVSSGEGMVGISWAFLMAGVSTTVVSQWSVDSASTTQLMLAFHSQFQKALDSGTGRALALRRGALAVMRSPEHRHPYYWAAFVMVGDGF
jgi:CHAT domain-containing protein